MLLVESVCLSAALHARGAPDKKEMAVASLTAAQKAGLFVLIPAFGSFIMAVALAFQGLTGYAWALGALGVLFFVSAVLTYTRNRSPRNGE